MDHQPVEWRSASGRVAALRSRAMRARTALAAFVALGMLVLAPAVAAAGDLQSTAVQARFVQAEFATYYHVAASGGSGKYRYQWALAPPSGDPGCNHFGPLPNDPTTAIWHHGDQDGCDHNVQVSGKGHPGTVAVVVGDGSHSCSASYFGTETGTGSAADCSAGSRSATGVALAAEPKGPPLLPIAAALIAAGALIAGGIALARQRAGSAPAASDCSELEAAAARAKAALEDAERGRHPIRELRDAAAQKQSDAESAHRAEEDALKGATLQGTNPDTGQPVYTFKGGTKARQAYDKAHAAAQAADAAARAAKDAYEKAGGDAAWQAAEDRWSRAQREYERAAEALKRCQDEAARQQDAAKPPVAPPASTPVTPPPPPDLRPRKECVDGDPDKQTLVVNEIVELALLYKSKLSKESSVRDNAQAIQNALQLLEWFEAGKELFDLGKSLKDAFSKVRPTEEKTIEQGLKDWAKDYGKSKVSSPSPTYSDVMMTEVPKALRKLVGQLQTDNDAADFTLWYPVHRYRITGWVICECRGGHWAVKSRRFDVAPIGHERIEHRDLGMIIVPRGDTSDLDKAVRNAMAPLIRANEAVEKEIGEDRQRLDGSDCSTAAAPAIPGDDEPPSPPG